MSTPQPEPLIPGTPGEFVVTEALSKVYYKGLPSQPPLIATTNSGSIRYPTGPEAYSILKELRELGDHPLANAWDHGLADLLRRRLNAMHVDWTSIDALRIVNVGEPESPGPAIVWIGVEPGTLNFERGSDVARECLTLINSRGVHDCHVEIRQSRVMRQAGDGFKFLEPVRLSDPTFSARDPYMAILGIPISSKERPWLEGTGGFYLSAGGDDTSIYLVTARHIVLPVAAEDENTEYERTADTEGRKDVIVLGTSAFKEKLAAIDYEIRGQESLIIDAQERIEAVQDLDDRASVMEREVAERILQEAQTALQELQDFRASVDARWAATERRVFGELVWAPPIVLSAEPGQYTLDLAVIKVDAGALDASNFGGNSINIGSTYTRQAFMDAICPNPHPAASPAPIKFPANRLFALHGQVPARDLADPPMLDADGSSCFVVFKHGARTGTTVGRASRVASYTRTCLAGEYRESREWPIIPTSDRNNKNRKSGMQPFSDRGDSGACVADAFGRVSGILTGGSGAACDGDSGCDVSYVTPISFIMEILRGTERFKDAHLDLVLT